MWITPGKTLLGIGLVLLVATSLPVRAENFARGQELFEHQCHGCHGDLFYAEKESKIKTLAELRQRITSWAVHSGTEWKKSEVDDVLHYMNKSFYHFKEGRF